MPTPPGQVVDEFAYASAVTHPQEGEPRTFTFRQVRRTAWGERGGTSWGERGGTSWGCLQCALPFVGCALRRLLLRSAARCAAARRHGGSGGSGGIRVAASSMCHAPIGSIQSPAAPAHLLLPNTQRVFVPRVAAYTRSFLQGTQSPA